MPFTSNKMLSVPVAGSLVGTWGAGSAGNDLNSGVMGILDTILGGITTLTLSSSAVTSLTQTQAQNGFLFVSGALTGPQTISPAGGVAMIGNYTFQNATTGASAVTVSNGVGMPLVLPQGALGSFWIDTTNGPRIIANTAATNGLASLTATGQLFSGGIHLQAYNYATGNITIDCGLGPAQFVTGNSVAWSITAPANDGSCLLLLTNPAASVNIPSFSGFKTASSTGDPLTAVANAVFTLSIWRINGTSSFTVKALQ